MALSKTHSIGLFGLAGTPIEIEADISAQLPSFVLVGLPDTSLAEATSRVRAACTNSGHPFPSQKVVVNLSPASVPKSGASFDLAIAVAVLVAMQVIPTSSVEGKCFIGELGLDGSVRPVPGVLPMTVAARRAGFDQVVVPNGNLAEAALVDGIGVASVGRLSNLVAYLRGEIPPHEEEIEPPTGASETPAFLPDLDQVIGQPFSVEGLVVAAAGGHHISMIGSPGSGKTMLAERMATILPQLSTEQAIELAAIESIAGDGQHAIELNFRPRFQAPHHSASRAALIGGGSGVPRPGAVSLAHHGVLFLDEALEFQSSVIDSLREPLESGRVVINRSAGVARFPARFQLVLAANPCPCGNFNVTGKLCTCSPQMVRRYANRLSGPIMDRIDIRLPVHPARISEVAGLGAPSTTSAEAAARVRLARETARDRLAPHGVTLNAHLPGPLIRKYLRLSPKATSDLDKLVAKGVISMRGYDRCLRLAWTLADLDGVGRPTGEHVQRAVVLRGADASRGA